MAESATPSTALKQAALSVLVVEDEKGLRDAIYDVLTMRGCSVDCAATGLEALSHVLAHEYHLVISDIHLPKMNGIELARMLSRRIRSPHIILMTSSSDPETLREAYATGAMQVLPKPLSLTVICRVADEVGAALTRSNG